MVMEERLRSKLLYKIELFLLKIIPMLMAVCSACNSILSYFDRSNYNKLYRGSIPTSPYISFFIFLCV